MTDTPPDPPDPITQLTAPADSRDTVETLVQTVLSEYYDYAEIEVTMGGIHLSWPHPDHPEGEPIIKLFFQGGTPIDGGPGFITQQATGTITTNASGAWQTWEDLEVQAPPDLHAELQGRFAPRAVDKDAIERVLSAHLSTTGR